MCALHIGSFGYEVNDVEYKWADKPVSYSKFEMAQFKLMDTRFCEVFETGSRKKTRGPYSHDATQDYRNDSIASLEIMLERQTGYFLLGVKTNPPPYKASEKVASFIMCVFSDLHAADHGRVLQLGNVLLDQDGKGRRGTGPHRAGCKQHLVHRQYRLWRQIKVIGV